VAQPPARAALFAIIANSTTVASEPDLMRSALPAVSFYDDSAWPQRGSRLRNITPCEPLALQEAWTSKVMEITITGCCKDLSTSEMETRDG
jgi:hypothetical protein